MNDKNLACITIKVVMIMSMLFISIPRVCANGDAVATYSSINRVANPQLLSISEICIESERLNITFEESYNCFDIRYIFENTSDKEFPEIDYGFPIDYLVNDEQEILSFNSTQYTSRDYEVGWNDRFIKDISFICNGEVLPFHCSKESVKEAGYEVDAYAGDSIKIEGINRRWFYTRFSMGPKSQITLDIRYKVYANRVFGTESHLFSLLAYKQYGIQGDLIYPATPLVCRYLGYHRTLLYDFSPAKHFGKGRSFPIYIDIDMTNLDNPNVQFKDYDCYITHLHRYIYFPSRDDTTIDLKIYTNVNLDNDYIVKRIEPLIINDDHYHLIQSDGVADIYFDKPTFVSELVCDVDTTMSDPIDLEVTFGNGKVKEYLFRKDKGEYYYKPIQSPVILVISSDNLDESGNSDDILANKVKSIKIKSKEIHSNSELTSIRNIRLLDSRF